MKKNVISKYGYSYKGVALDQVSECVPDQSLSVEEILRRFTQGTLLTGDVERSMPYGDDITPEEDENNMDPLYDPETDIVDVYMDAASGADIRGELEKRKAAARKNAKDALATPSDEVPPQSDERENP